MGIPFTPVTLVVKKYLWREMVRIRTKATLRQISGHLPHLSCRKGTIGLVRRQIITINCDASMMRPSEKCSPEFTGVKGIPIYLQSRHHLVRTAALDA